MKKHFTFIALFIALISAAQKKPLDHTVYDGWQSIGEKYISNNGKFVVYTVTPQEGDATLVIQQTDGKKLMEIPCGYNASISNDCRFVAFKIKPPYKQTRDAKIKKKKADDLPKDTFALVTMETLQLEKFPRVKSYKFPSKSPGWLVWQYEKPLADTSKKKDSTSVKLSPPKDMLFADADSDNSSDDKKEDGTLLILRNLSTGATDSLQNINDYFFDDHGTRLLLKSSGSKKDSIKPSVIVLDLSNHKKDTILYKYNDAKSFAWDTAGQQLAFVAERDSSSKAVQKFYKLFYYKVNDDSAHALVERTNKAIPANWGISENADVHFSKSGRKIFFGTAPVLPPKDTTLPEFERANVDVWNYKDDDLMTVQLKNLDKDLKRNYTASYDIAGKQLIQLEDESFKDVMETMEGDGETFYTATDSGRRVARQWQGFTLADAYAVNASTGQKKLIIKNFKGSLYPSYTGRYLLLYDDRQRGYFVYNSKSGKLYKAATDIKAPLYDEENDVPDDPNPYGIAKWMQDDKYVFIYDRYDIWRVDPEGKEKSSIVNFPLGRQSKLSYRYVQTDEEEKYIASGQDLFLKIFDEKTKGSLYVRMHNPTTYELAFLTEGRNTSSNNFMKAKNADVFIYSKENFSSPPDLYVTSNEIDSSYHADKPKTEGWHVGGLYAVKLSNLNPQQSQYLWGTAELFKWKAYTGKETEGILYKPEGFDAKKKYPMIVYFYERNNSTLNSYVAPSPTPSRLNVSFFVSRGYVVFVPDIWYTTGHPGKSAYDYIVSGTRALIKQGFIDSTKIGLQGQSWGGYQTAFLITQTNLYKDAWAGAPVANMFSAYGGIRWESGYNRQMQYERQQSRIGATIWQKPQLYIENSPLFHLPNVKTPLVIMSNDADGAVPWYQGIEMFTAMRRLNKPVWLLNYNNEAHNLVERRNRKDIQIREQEFFDWQLKGAAPVKWLTEGVPAVMKGRTWGL